MSLSLSPRTALIVIDVQNGFTLAPYSSLNFYPSLPSVLANIASTIQAFRTASLPVIHIHHASLEPDSPLNPEDSPEGYKVLPSAAPLQDETIFVKHVNSSFIGTRLEEHLRREEIKTLVIVGLTTAHCVSTTTRMAGNLGWEVFLARDGTGMFEMKAAPGGKGDGFNAETMHEVALSELHGEFATVVATDRIVEALRKVE
ncbi:isochorismatase hydrolase [Roridomyces roridus]|uniref:Isochorismatase hydrolase n=1 Tax=Roridomyces roridus TaxID=1738132 RepID=A0AAD7C794_9AGAR|nr:isochorismatase hydrolase [Roridomyces roridus]